MVYVITKNNRGIFGRELDSMHRDRKQVFVDKLKWNIPVVDGIYEKDQFDSEEAVYIVAADPHTGQHHASLRMMPSMGAHMLRDVFPSLCEDGVPTGPDIWEMTRICISPALARADAHKNLGLIWLGAVEFGVQMGIRTITGLTHAQLISNILAAGIDIEPLGPPKMFDGMQFGALQVRVSETVLARERKRLEHPDIVLSYDRVAAAA